MGNLKEKKITPFLLVCLLSLLLMVLSGRVVVAEDPANQAEIKEDIENIESKIEKEQAEREKLEQELGQIQQSVNYTQGEVRKTESFVQGTREDISRAESEIELANEKMNFQRRVLASLVREMYYSRSNSPVVALLDKSNFSQFLGGLDHIALIQQKVFGLIEDIKSSKGKLEGEKVKFEELKKDHERLLALKQDQQQALLSEKYETQGDIQEKEATIAELNAKLYKLRSNLSGYLGKSYNAKDIEDAARFASKVSGVRKDFIMGMLVVESDLGRFTGGCYAKDSRMSGRRLELFKDICDELDYEWKKRKVSCPPSSYSGTGGAMGVAQFMSDTWIGYKSRIASVTGHNPPDPWNLTDGVVAMGLKLAKGGATKKSGECNAAKLYLSGTTSSKYNWYCQRVLYWANNYERLLD
ncbi:MAG: lytic murein transglycosylase [Candidatus Moranbacteria bacterium]|nr:lytic murein transglycosylase [Candidatus Moranbacteria bacterium]